MSLNSARNFRQAGFDFSLVSSFIPYWSKRVLASLSLKPTCSSVPRAVRMSNAECREGSVRSCSLRAALIVVVVHTLCENGLYYGDRGRAHRQGSAESFAR